MIKVVYAMGDPCPIPVIKTKKAIEEMVGNGIVETMVDNEIAVQNLKKMAAQKGLEARSEQLDSDEFRVIINVKNGDKAREAAAHPQEPEKEETAVEEPVVCPVPAKKKRVAVISSETMGTGNDELGAVLMKGFVYALAAQEEPVDTILFYNGGVKLTTGDSPLIDDLKDLEAKGCEILSCGTCLDFYELTGQLKVGSVTNMYDIAAKMTEADLIVKP